MPFDNTMKHSIALLIMAAHQPLLVLGSGHRINMEPPPTSCTFAMTSTGPFSFPAGRLEDGQIRFNGSYPTTQFTMVNGSMITDSAGFGCIVTESPTTQFQCDMNKTPDLNFGMKRSEDDHVLLAYKDSTEFYACPASDTEYNVYIKPDFGQTKCVPVQIVVEGECATGGENVQCPPTTVWHTEYVTELVTQWSTVTVTPDSASVSVSASTSTGGGDGDGHNHGWDTTATPTPSTTGTYQSPLPPVETSLGSGSGGSVTLTHTMSTGSGGDLTSSSTIAPIIN